MLTDAHAALDHEAMAVLGRWAVARFAMTDPTPGETVGPKTSAELLRTVNAAEAMITGIAGDAADRLILIGAGAPISQPALRAYGSQLLLRAQLARRRARPAHRPVEYSIAVDFVALLLGCFAKSARLSRAKAIGIVVTWAADAGVDLDPRAVVKACDRAKAKAKAKTKTTP